MPPGQRQLIVLCDAHQCDHHLCSHLWPKWRFEPRSPKMKDQCATKFWQTLGLKYPATPFQNLALCFSMRPALPQEKTTEVRNRWGRALIITPADSVVNTISPCLYWLLNHCQLRLLGNGLWTWQHSVRQTSQRWLHFSSGWHGLSTSRWQWQIYGLVFKVAEQPPLSLIAKGVVGAHHLRKSSH